MENKHNDSLLPNQRQPLEVADIFRLYGGDYRRSRAVSYDQLKAMRHIEKCRTTELGGHLNQCNQCGFEKIAYNSDIKPPLLVVDPERFYRSGEK